MFDTAWLVTYYSSNTQLKQEAQLSQVVKIMENFTHFFNPYGVNNPARQPVVSWRTIRSFTLIISKECVEFIIMLMKKVKEQSIENCLAVITWLTHYIGKKAFWVLVQYYS